MMDALAGYFRDRHVLVTGHTGFKGAWLCEWLLAMGARVTGVGLPPETRPSLFEQLRLAERVNHHLLDVREAAPVAARIAGARPDVVIHMAAQPLVRYAYAHPLETFGTNVMGTAHVLDALRCLEGPCEAVIVTTDKCYENRERPEPYHEDEPMGGHDPYSASKGAAELVTASYRRSYFPPECCTAERGVAVASARAGNVIGGGDWAADRIVPDCVRALSAGRAINVRNAVATRPWQHVMEPLGGYLTLAREMAEARGSERMEAVCSAFNFGPDPKANRPVRDLVETVLRHWPGEWTDATEPGAPHEAGLLNLSIRKAEQVLGWRPVWDFETSVAATIDWYWTVRSDPDRSGEATRAQIADYKNTKAHAIYENKC